MVYTKATALAGAFFATVAAAQDMTSDEMGPAGFIWPPDREWSDKHDNTPPCGSDAPAGERTLFPLTNGKLALVAQDNVRAVHVSVSYENDPQSMDDFETFFGPNEVGALDLGHTCITVPDTPSNIRVGANATFSILYVSNFEENEADRTTHYACTDVTFVELAEFDTRIPCFNSTISNPEVEVDETVNTTTTDEDGNTPHTVEDFTEDDDEEEEQSSGSSGISGGAIAGAVVGSVAGVGILAAAAVWLFRRKSQEKKKEADQMRQVDAEKAANSDTLSTRS